MDNVGGFQSTPFLRRVTYGLMIAQLGESISIHTLLAKGDPETLDTFKEIAISIHTLLAKGDVMPVIPSSTCTNFNPHPSCEG